MTPLDWQAIALKASIIVIIAGSIFGAGFYAGVKANSPGNVAVAQHAQDVKQHNVAASTSQKAAKQAADTERNTAAQVQIVHDTKTIFVRVPVDCPVDPAIDPAILGAYNKAGH